MIRDRDPFFGLSASTKGSQGRPLLSSEGTVQYLERYINGGEARDVMYGGRQGWRRPGVNVTPALNESITILYPVSNTLILRSASTFRCSTDSNDNLRQQTTMVTYWRILVDLCHDLQGRVRSPVIHSTPDLNPPGVELLMRGDSEPYL